MIIPVLDLIHDADSYVCHWRDGELYVEQADAAAN